MNWLLLRGLTRTQAHWAEFPKILETAPENFKFKTHCLDHAGFGVEAHRSSPTSIEEMLQDLRGRWLELKKTSDSSENWGILGISLGAMLTYAWAKNYPQDFERAVMINPSAANLGKPWERMKLSSFWKLLKAAQTKDPELRERRILKLCCESQFGKLPFPPQGLSKRQALRQLLAASRFEIQKSLEIPALVLGSKNDQIVDPLVVRRFALRLGASYQLHPWAGHDLPLDDPTWTIEKIVEWMASRGESPNIQSTESQQQ
jgi:pimeloyl-ACP methyl ester carboxylesterase